MNALISTFTGLYRMITEGIGYTITDFAFILSDILGTETHSFIEISDKWRHLELDNTGNYQIYPTPIQIVASLVDKFEELQIGTKRYWGDDDTLVFKLPPIDEILHDLHRQRENESLAAYVLRIWEDHTEITTPERICQVFNAVKSYRHQELIDDKSGYVYLFADNSVLAMPDNWQTDEDPDNWIYAFSQVDIQDYAEMVSVVDEAIGNLVRKGKASLVFDTETETDMVHIHGDTDE